MSHEKHDQNQGLETPDTAPSFMRVIILGITIYMLVACVGYFFFFGITFEETDVSSLDPVQENRTLEERAAQKTAAYLVPTTNPLLIPEQVAFANMAEGKTIEEIATLMGINPEINTIFIDPNGIEGLDGTWLRQQHDLGRTIVGLKIPHSELSALLGLPQNEPDLTLDVQQKSVVWISVRYLRNDEPAELVSSYNQFSDMLAVIGSLSQ